MANVFECVWVGVCVCEVVARKKEKGLLNRYMKIIYINFFMCYMRLHNIMAIK